MAVKAAVISELPKRRRKPRYPWDQWMEGDPYRLVKGRHFDITVEGMRGNILAKASSEGIAVRVFRGTMVEGEPAPRRTLYMQFYPGRTYAQGPPDDDTDS